MQFNYNSMTVSDERFQDKHVYAACRPVSSPGPGFTGIMEYCMIFMNVLKGQPHLFCHPEYLFTSDAQFNYVFKLYKFNLFYLSLPFFTCKDSGFQIQVLTRGYSTCGYRQIYFLMLRTFFFMSSSTIANFRMNKNADNDWTLIKIH